MNKKVRGIHVENKETPSLGSSRLRRDIGVVHRKTVHIVSNSHFLDNLFMYFFN